MTFVVVGDDSVLEQVRKQLEKIVTVVRVDDISSQDHVERDLMLIKVAAKQGHRSEVRELTEIFRGRIVDVGAEMVMIEIAGQERKIEAFIEMMRPFGIIELVRTGRIAMVRGGNQKVEEAKATNDQAANDQWRYAVDGRRARPTRFNRSTDNRQLSTDNRGAKTMTAEVFYDKDADLSLLKNKTIAILGYGSQGHGHAQNLRDSGCNVIVAELEGTANYEQAVKDGFKPISAAAATKQADIITMLLPDEVQADVFRAEVRDNLSPGNILVCSHGFNVHFNQFEIPKGVATILVAPKGPGHLVRAEFVKGGGVPCLIALGPNADDTARKIGLAYAKGIGGTRAGVIETTFAEETETDLFGEQVVLCGGITALIKAGYETLVEAGYQPEMAYFECMHEVKLIVDLLYQGGMNYMRYSISNTAEYGDYTRGPRIITDETKAEMRKILKEIQTGQFAREWILENKAERPVVQGDAASGAGAPDRGGRPPTAAADDLDQRQGGVGLPLPLGEGWGEGSGRLAEVGASP